MLEYDPPRDIVERPDIGPDRWSQRGRLSVVNNPVANRILA
jgi:hypothetical protein